MHDFSYSSKGQFISGSNISAMLRIRGQKGKEDTAYGIDYIPFWSPWGKLRNESLAVLKWRLLLWNGITMLQETHLIKFSSILLTESNSLDVNSGLFSANSCPSGLSKNNLQYPIGWPGIYWVPNMYEVCTLVQEERHGFFPKLFSLVEESILPKPILGPAVW